MQVFTLVTLIALVALVMKACQVKSSFLWCDYCPWDRRDDAGVNKV